MKRNMSAKRSRSPLPDGKSGYEDVDPVPDLDEIPGTRIPGFLCMGPQRTYIYQQKNCYSCIYNSTNYRIEISGKFQELVWEERGRSMNANKSGSPSHPYKKVDTPKTRALDRYGNIQPWHGNRIRLRVPPGQNDYINASPIRLTSRKDLSQHAWITMQGPKESTTSHVWRMIHHEMASPAVIIMLTETHEGGQEKCFPYFPQDISSAPLIVNEADEFGDGFKASVRCVEFVDSPFPDAIQIRKLAIQAEGQNEEKIVYHVLYSAWPDFGVPQMDALEPIHALMEISKNLNLGPENPKLIHCSAGVGRTGTYIALEYLLSELDNGVYAIKSGPQTNADMYDPVFDTVNQLRKQRMSMVQADVQYLFLYQVLRQAFEKKYPDSSPAPDSGDSEPSAKVARRASMDDVFS
jgi:protein-tyrosine phosphatase